LPGTNGSHLISQPGQIVWETLSQKPTTKKELVEWLKALSSNSSTKKKKVSHLKNGNENKFEYLEYLRKEKNSQLSSALIDKGSPNINGHQWYLRKTNDKKKKRN
jgi:hypothetical protein